MRDYMLGATDGTWAPVSRRTTLELIEALSAIGGPEWVHTGANGSATLEDIRDRIRLELEIRAMGLTSE